MELSETRNYLISGLKLILKNKDVILAIVLMLKTEVQMPTMIDWIIKHSDENPHEDRVLRIAQAIQKEVE